MLFSLTVILAALAMGASCAHFKIPEVESTVNRITHEFSPGLHSLGNQSDGFYLQERDLASYWYESIAHQGISAFGPSGYKVFRNVKDYGAQGVLDTSTMRNLENPHKLTTDQVMVLQMILWPLMQL
jgi:hypothetical protein